MKFDIIVIGGGHAGIEAAYIAAKKLKVLLVTNNIDLIGQMSCNPSIGGVAKGNIVREIDALGGLMAKVIDKAGIHFKMLNTSKGTAVWGNRAQADKVLYRTIIREELEKCPNVYFLQGMVKRINVENGSVKSIIMDSKEEIDAKAIILCAGTFLNGIAHIGLNSFPSGRTGEPPSTELTESIIDLGIKTGRLKTGTSPRIDGRTVDFSKFIKQDGDEKPWPFSFSNVRRPQNKVSCWVGRTTDETHKIITDNLDRSPLYTGKIKSIGPRYCPSIEDKIVRFGERDGHTLFLEPESLYNNEMYINGLSTSLPFDVQIKMVKSIIGLENASILRPGYGIEYDYFQPNQLLSTLESKIIKNLFFAGQINGTSGYEEAAGQGIVAGINAAQNVLSEEPVILGRDTSYIGVLIDDLVTRGTEEPYRMFTSRAEYRLLLRQDNCDERLMPIAYNNKFIEHSIFENRKKIWDYKNNLIEKFKLEKIDPEIWNSKNNETKLLQKISAFELIKRPEININEVLECTDIKIEENEFFLTTLESDIKYEGFIQKQKFEIEKNKKLEFIKIPVNIDYKKITGLLTETQIKLSKIRPETLGQASRIPGITPADLSILGIYISKYGHVKVSRETMEVAYE